MICRLKPVSKLTNLEECGNLNHHLARPRRAARNLPAPTPPRQEQFGSSPASLEPIQAQEDFFFVGFEAQLNPTHTNESLQDDIPLDDSANIMRPTNSEPFQPFASEIIRESLPNQSRFWIPMDGNNSHFRNRTLSQRSYATAPLIPPHSDLDEIYLAPSSAASITYPSHHSTNIFSETSPLPTSQSEPFSLDPGQIERLPGNEIPPLPSPPPAHPIWHKTFLDGVRAAHYPSCVKHFQQCFCSFCWRAVQHGHYSADYSASQN